MPAEQYSQSNIRDAIETRLDVPVLVTKPSENGVVIVYSEHDPILDGEAMRTLLRRVVPAAMFVSFVSIDAFERERQSLTFRYRVASATASVLFIIGTIATLLGMI